MHKLLIGLGGLAAVSLLVSGIAKHSHHGALGVLSNLSWAGFLASAAAVVIIGAGTLVRR